MCEHHMFDRDVYTANHLGGLCMNRIVNRGTFPKDIDKLDRRDQPFLRRVPGGFVNLTRSLVPSDVCALFSYGPKFMIPTYTLMSVGERNVEFRNMIRNLRLFGYSCAGYGGEACPLLLAYKEHTSDSIKLNRMERSILHVVSQAMALLKRVRKIALIALGDKGKKVGLVYKFDYMRLCNDYINTALMTCMYEELHIKDISKFIQEVRSGFHRNFDIIRLRNFRQYPYDCLYIANMSESNMGLIEGLNKQVVYLLSRIEWRCPSFSPTLKFHKDPLALRPVISKCGGPSIALGRVIKMALERIW